MIQRLICCVMVSFSLDCHAQVVLPAWDTIKIKTTDLGSGLFVLEGFGGNIGVLIGDDGVLLVDDQYDELAEKNIAAIRELTSSPIEFVINTHWHGDHSGGNHSMKALGAHIISTDEARHSMQTHHNDTHKFEDVAPIATFRDQMTFHMNGQIVRVFKVRPSHTSGDAIVEFQPANVIHMGDTSFNGFYPFIDVDNGGSINGMIALHQEIYNLANNQTTIIFGHGPIGNRTDLLRYESMLTTVRDRVVLAIEAGTSLNDLIEAAPLSDLDPEWGGNLIKAPTFLKMVYQSLMQANEKTSP